MNRTKSKIEKAFTLLSSNLTYSGFQSTSLSIEAVQRCEDEGKPEKYKNLRPTFKISFYKEKHLWYRREQMWRENIRKMLKLHANICTAHFNIPHLTILSCKFDNPENRKVEHVTGRNRLESRFVFLFSYIREVMHFWVLRLPVAFNLLYTLRGTPIWI